MNIAEKKALTPEEYAQLVTQMRELRQAGMKYHEIAAVVKRTPSTVWQALQGQVAPVKDRRAKDAATLRDVGMSWDAIARACEYRNAHVAQCAAARYRKRCMDRALWAEFGIK